MPAQTILAVEKVIGKFARRGVQYGEPSRSELQRVLNGAKIRNYAFPRVWEATDDFPDDPKPTWAQRRSLRKIRGMFRSI